MKGLRGLGGFTSAWGSRASGACNNFVGMALYPDPREDLESKARNLGPYTTKGTL